MRCLEMNRERFMASLGNLELQNHLVGVSTLNLEPSVRAGNEYLQMTATHAGSRESASRTYQLCDEPPKTEAVIPEDRVESVRDDNHDEHPAEDSGKSYQAGGPVVPALCLAWGQTQQRACTAQLRYIIPCLS